MNFSIPQRMALQHLHRMGAISPETAVVPTLAPLKVFKSLHRRGVVGVVEDTELVAALDILRKDGAPKSLSFPAHRFYLLGRLSETTAARTHNGKLMPPIFNWFSGKEMTLLPDANE